MSPRPGDRVRVAFEGTVVDLQSDGDMIVRVRGWATNHRKVRNVPMEVCEVIPEPVKVGDEIKPSQLGSLPRGSVVLGSFNEMPYRRSGNGTWLLNGVSVDTDNLGGTFRVLHLGSQE